jgi:hypothetical protein
MRIHGALCLCTALLAAAPAATQTVRVSVVDAASGAPVEGAMVRVETVAGELAQAGFTDRRGEVRLRLEDPGPYYVRATRGGYAPGGDAVSIGPSGETAAALRLSARPYALDTVTVVGSTGTEVGKQTFERRSLTGRGIYLDSAYVARREGLWPADLLSSVPGVDVRLETGRIGYRRASLRGGRCLRFLVNGMPFYGGWPQWVTLEETLRRSDVVAIEVYREPDEVPHELRSYAWTRGRCGVIVYWTEDGWQSTSRGADPDAG